MAQADNLRIEDVRGALLTESKVGFKLRLDAPPQVNGRSSTFEVARAMAAAWGSGATEAVATIIAHAELSPTDPHLWAVIGEIVRQIPASDPVAKALSAIQRNATTVTALAQRVAATESSRDLQLSLQLDTEES